MVSIVIPVFNQPQLLKTMVDSVINQSYTDWELILIDDGSDNSTLTILNEYAETDCRISLLRRPETALKGAQTCRNMGLCRAKGEYILFYDSDDIIYKDALMQRVNFMQNNPDIDFAVFPYKSFSNDDFSDLRLKSGFDLHQDDLYYLISGATPFLVWTNIYRRESLIKNEVQWDKDLKGFQDADFNIQCICAGMTFRYATGAKPDYYIRMSGNPNSISKKIASVEYINSHIHFIKKLYNYRLPQTYNSAIFKRVQYIVIKLLAADCFDFNGFLDILEKQKSSYYYRLRLSLYCFRNLSRIMKKLCNIQLIIKISFMDYYFSGKIHDYKINRIRKRYEKNHC